MEMRKRNPWLFAQVALLVCLVLFLASGFRTGGISSSADFTAVESSVLATLEPGVYPQQDTQKIRRYLDIDPALTENISFYRLDDAMSANELVLIQFDPANREALQKAIEERRAAQENIYEGYAPEQAQLMKDALIDFENNYALYYVGSNPQAAQDAFRSAL